ncbi:hypothetical protein ACLKA7_002706 [Drosophila subpalustris]
MSCWPKLPRDDNGIDGKWNHMQASSSSHKPTSSTWDKWHEHNMKVTQELSILMKRPVLEVSELLYNLTLQNYNNILNPIGKGWNSRRIPFSRFDACDRYLSVFDLNGNLREPRHPRSLILLLEFMQSIIGNDSETETSIRQISRDLTFSAGTYSSSTSSKLAKDSADVNEKYVEKYPYHEDKTYFMYSRQLGRLIDPDVDKMAAAIERRKLVVNNNPTTTTSTKAITTTINTGKITSSPRESQFGDRDDTPSISDRRVRGDYRNILMSISSSSNQSDFILTDDKGRRRGQGSVQLDLRSERAKFLRQILHKIKKSDPDRFLKGLLDLDLKNPQAKQKKAKNETDDLRSLAKFYATVVTKRKQSTIKLKTSTFKFKRLSKEPKLAKNQTAQRTFDDNAKATVQKVAQANERERKYFGEPLPVLFHAPYDNRDQTTWLRREPNQLRMQEDGHLGRSSVQRYRRDSVQSALYQAKRTYSIHSLNSQVVQFATNVELQKKPEYKRIFPSTSSRRFKAVKRATSKRSLIRSK